MRNIPMSTAGLRFLAAETSARPVTKYEDGQRIDGPVLDDGGHTLYAVSVFLVGDDTAEQIRVKFPHDGKTEPTYTLMGEVTIEGAVATPYVANGKAAISLRASSVRPTKAVASSN